MPQKRPREPIAPTTIPGEPTDPKIPEEAPGPTDERKDIEEDQPLRESEAALDRATTRLPPD
jgi:hypothetical protein